MQNLLQLERDSQRLTDAKASESLDHRQVLAAQLRLLAVRSERGFPLDIRSIKNLFRAFRAVLSAEELSA